MKSPIISLLTLFALTWIPSKELLADTNVACVHKRTKVLRIDTACKKNENPLDLKSVGIQGPPGPQGPQGPAGNPQLPGATLDSLATDVHSNVTAVKDIQKGQKLSDIKCDVGIPVKIGKKAVCVNEPDTVKSLLQDIGIQH